MQNDIVPVQQHQPAPFGQGRNLAAHANVGAIAIEQERAIAEAQGQLILAKRFPRNETGAYDQLMRACKSKAFAETAFYKVPNRGEGPSIRFAEEVARVYGNFQYGHRELSRSEGKSEIEVFAWDMENNNRSTRQITVLHVRDTSQGPKVLRDQADIDNKIANVASKQIRGRILALMPKWLVAEAIHECQKTIAGNNDEPIEARVRRMTQAFGKYGVTIDHLEKYLGHTLDQTTIDEVVDLTGVFNALKEGTPASEVFSAAETEGTSGEAEKLAATARAGAEAKAAEAKTEAKPAAPRARPAARQPAPTPEPAPAPEPTPESAAAAAPEPEPAPPVDAPPSDDVPTLPGDDGVDLF